MRDRVLDMTPKVSVIIPVYNTAPYLRRCLNSVAGQKLRDIEIICVNDGSTDDSPKILQEYAAGDMRIRRIDFAENKGVSFARNAGIDAACGEYVGFVDSDDYPEYDFYEQLYVAAKTANADVAKGNYRKNDGSVDHYMNDQIKVHKTNFIYEFCSCVINLQLIKQNKIYFPIDLINFEDPVFIFQISLFANKVIIIDNAYINIVSRKNSLSRITTNSLLRIKSVYKGIERIIDMATSRNIHKKSYAFVVMLLIGSTFSYLYKNANKQNRDYIIYEMLRLYHKFKKVEQFTTALREGNNSLFKALSESDTGKLSFECEHMRNIFNN
jgi:glycosyltransferase involved in cell wall biosynthesis